MLGDKARDAGNFIWGILKPLVIRDPGSSVTHCQIFCSEIAGVGYQLNAEIKARSLVVILSHKVFVDGMEPKDEEQRVE
jgi:hypothetical protein